MLITIPLLYRLFFLYIEPISALVGSYFAAGAPATYLHLLASTASKSTLDVSSNPPNTPTLVSLYQLSNLYLLFALNEHLVLSSATSLITWRRLLFCLLIADFGHLATMYPLAVERGLAVGRTEALMRVYAYFWEWNAMDWGSVGFVYCGALMRLSFLLGVGLSSPASEDQARRQSKQE
ncbi:hypothetical protein EIP91_001301 [Steccherinum ochraceum]|uniref:DUF7704 domain-containing protein n=1 Tax=Steccherinum ochraceum TaxID=92696 RepID=A0A4R0RKR0_9APHY|nr:hypothetical protein EIP91_001301 [Steccherinum ochraceum]